MTGTIFSRGSASIQAVDPFGSTSANNDCNSAVAGTCLVNDTVANLTVKLADVGGVSAKLLNVCSYPSQEPNSDPSDCIFESPAGFLTIVKSASPNNGTPFVFNLGTGQSSTNGTSTWTINGSGSTAANIYWFVIPNGGLNTLDLTEAIPAGWKLTNVSCAIQTNPPTATGTAPATLPVLGATSAGVTDFEIRAGLETICTFTDIKQAGSIQIVKNTVGGIAGQTYSFGFTPSGFASNTAFTVQTTGVNGTGNSSTYGGLAPGSTYSVSETTVATGWALTSSACKIDGAAAGTPAAITVQDGKTTICTLTNTENLELTRGKIKIAKVTDPSSDTTTSFGYTTDYEALGFNLVGGGFQPERLPQSRHLLCDRERAAGRLVAVEPQLRGHRNRLPETATRQRAFRPWRAGSVDCPRGGRHGDL